MDDNPYLSPNSASTERTSGDRFGVALIACVIAAAGILWPAPGFWELYRCPAGSAIRPMGQAGAIFLFGFGTPILALPWIVVAYLGGGRGRWLAVVAGVLACVPFPLYLGLFQWIVIAHRLTLKE